MYWPIFVLAKSLSGTTGIFSLYQYTYLHKHDVHPMSQTSLAHPCSNIYVSKVEGNNKKWHLSQKTWVICKNSETIKRPYLPINLLEKNHNWSQCPALLIHLAADLAHFEPLTTCSFNLLTKIHTMFSIFKTKKNWLDLGFWEGSKSWIKMTLNQKNNLQVEDSAGINWHHSTRTATAFIQSYNNPWQHSRVFLHKNNSQLIKLNEEW